MIRRAGLILSLLVLCCAIGAPACRRATVAFEHGSPVTAGQRAAQQALTVYIFMRADCPVANRYIPTIRRLAQDYADRPVTLRLVYPHADDTSARRHAREAGLDLPVVTDPRFELVTHTGAQVTPEAAIETPSGEVLYCGRIDDRYVDFGRARRAAERHDLREALEAALAGRPVPPPGGPAIGCYIHGVRP